MENVEQATRPVVREMRPVHQTIESAIPEALRESITAYVRYGVPTGGFLRRVLSNDLFGARAKADDVNRYLVFAICVYISNAVPECCYGSASQVEAHLENARNLAGR